jgi:hypothetical protein
MFPGYTVGQLAAIFAALAEEADSRSSRLPHIRPPPYWDRPKAAINPAMPDWPSGC